jgi:hypothetical protein
VISTGSVVVSSGVGVAVVIASPVPGVGVGSGASLTQAARKQSKRKARRVQRIGFFISKILLSKRFFVKSSSYSKSS